MPEVDDDAAAQAFTALGHPIRVKIVRMLATRDPTPLTAVAMARELGTPGKPLPAQRISFHMSALRQAGVVSATREQGVTILYRLATNLPAFASVLGLRAAAPASAPVSREAAEALLARSKATLADMDREISGLRIPEIERRVKSFMLATAQDMLALRKNDLKYVRAVVINGENGRDQFLPQAYSSMVRHAAPWRKLMDRVRQELLRPKTDEELDARFPDEQPAAPVDQLAQPVVAAETLAQPAPAAEPIQAIEEPQQVQKARTPLRLPRRSRWSR